MTVVSPTERAARAKRRAGGGRSGAAEEPSGQLGFDLEPPQRRPVAAPPFAGVSALEASAFGPASPRARSTAGPVGASTPVPPAVLAPVPIAAAGVRRPAVARAGAGTLDAVLTGTWHGLQAHGSVRCPVCRGAMSPRYAAGPRPVGGRCRDCGTTVA